MNKRTTVTLDFIFNRLSLKCGLELENRNLGGKSNRGKSEKPLGALSKSSKVGIDIFLR